MNRRGFLATLAALAIAPKDLALPEFPAPKIVSASTCPLTLAGIAGWLPLACVVADRFCPPDSIFVIGAEARMDWKVDGEVHFFGLERGKPVILTHPSHEDELRAAVHAAVERVGRAAERDMFAG